MGSMRYGADATSNALEAVAFGNQLFVAVGPGGLILASAGSQVAGDSRRRARREEPLEDCRDSGNPVLAGTAVAAECEGSLEEEELAEKISRVISDLAEPRDVAVRMYLAGYNHREIAALLGWTEAKARNLLYRGLADLRVKLTAVGVGPRGAVDRH